MQTNTATLFACSIISSSLSSPPCFTAVFPFLSGFLLSGQLKPLPAQAMLKEALLFIAVLPE